MGAPRPLHVVTSILVGAYLGRRGLRKGSLSKSGAMAAFAVAVLTWGSGPRFGITLIAFYLSGSKLSRVGAATKMRQDEAATEGGARDAAQVLCCSLPAALAAAAYRAEIGDDARADLAGDAGDARGAALVARFVAFFAVCAGDTWASELGCLAAAPPRLVTAPWRVVPPGTNGGVTLAGTAASVAGGAFVGVVHGLAGFATVGASAAGARAEVAGLAALGAAAGFAGSLLDSVLGATLQRTSFDDAKRCVARPERSDARALCGADVLSNHGVNLVSATAVMLAAPRAARWWLLRAQ